MKRPFSLVALTVLLTCCLHSAIAQPEPILVGSKTFTESYLLGEIVAQLLENSGIEVERQLGLGGTLVAFEALKAGSVDVYPDYTGTLSQAVLGRPGLEIPALEELLGARGLQLPVYLGFENSYAIAVREDMATDLGLSRISDLRAHPNLRAIFSH